MQLTIHQLNASDFGSYKCVCKNYIGEVDGSITLNGEPNAYTCFDDAYWK